MSTLRRKMLRVAAARGSGPDAGGIKLGQLLFDVGGPRRALDGDALDGCVERDGISALGGDAAQREQGGQIVRLRGENLLDQLLKFLFAARGSLALDFERERVAGAQVFRIEADGFA